MILLSTASVLAANPTRGQGLGQEIFIGMRNEGLEALIKKIEASSNFTFAYYSTAFEPYNDITFESATRTIREALDLGFAGTQLEYIVRGNVIIVSNKKTEGAFIPKANEFLESPTEDIRISGTVKDYEGAPLAGVNVLVKGTTIGTSTDSKGEFTLDVPAESKFIVFSFVGLKTVEMAFDGRSRFDIDMQADATDLKAVEISGGYYTTTNEAKIGSIVKVAAKDIGKQPVTNPLMALQGRVPGLEIVPYSGTAGGAVKVVIRGRNSLRNNTPSETINGPLFVIDGLPIDSSPLRSGTAPPSPIPFGYDPISTINPESIESIEVLKDGDATSIYGSRGANGVILITTKRSQRAGKLTVDLSTYVGVGKISNRMDLLNTEQYLEMRNEAFENNNAQPNMYMDFDVNGAWDKTRYTDWQDVLLGGKAHINDIQAGISGGSSNTTFKFTGSFHKENVVYSGDFGYQRRSGNLSINHVSPDQRFSATMSVMYGAETNRLFEDPNFVSQALTLPPNAPPLYNSDGTLNWQIVDFGFFKLNSFRNPMAALKNTNDSKTDNLIANAMMSYAITTRLSAKINIGFTDLDKKELLKFPLAAVPDIPIYSGTTGRNVVSQNNRRSWIIEPQLSYIGDFGNSSLNIVFGGSVQKSLSEYLSVSGFEYLSDLLLDNLGAASFSSVDADNENDYRYLACFFRVGYDWKHRYLFSLTGRRDGSSRFGPGRQFGNFGSIGAAWIFSNEPFVKNGLMFLSFGKIRGSYGITGNDQIGDYKFYNTYKISPYRYDNNVTLSPTALFNPDYSWEETKKIEAAIELGFLDDRISLEIDFYRNRSSNQLVNYQLPVITGANSVFSNFNATVENTGWEAMFSLMPIQKPNFNWTVALNVSANRNKLVAFPGIETSPYSSLYKVGEPLSIQRLYTYKGVASETGRYEVLDLDDSGSITVSDQEFMNPIVSKYYGGVNNTVRYKSFELSFLIQFVDQTKREYEYSLPGTGMNMPVQVLDRWRQTGDISNVGSFSQSDEDLSYYSNYVRVSNYGIADASFVRLKTLSLSYSLPASLIEAAKLGQARLYVQGQNLFTISDYLGFDPETGTSLPPLWMITGGVQFTF